MKIRLSLLTVCLLTLPQLALAVPVTVEVVDQKGAPVAGALVVVQSFAPVAKGEKPLTPTQTSGADGLAKFDLQSSNFEPDFFGRSVVFKAGYGIGGGDVKATQLRVALRAPAARSGRVLDIQGAPIAGAKVELTYIHDAGAVPYGILRSDRITPRDSILQPSISKDGYQLRGELKIVDDGGDITTAPLVMVKSAATARGSVVNGTGQGAARARVAAANVEVIADENGAFALQNLPAGELLVSALAADEHAFGAATLPLQNPIELRVPTLITRDRALAQSIINALKVETAGTTYWAKDQLDFPDDNFVARVKASAEPISPFYELSKDASIPTAQALEAFALLHQSDDVLRGAAQIITWRPNWKDDARAGEFLSREESYRYRLNRYILAMARVSPQRALEMAREIPADAEYSSFSARDSLARALAGEKMW